MLSDKKKNTEASYTLDELETEINSLSGPEGKTVTFRNLGNNSQKIVVYQPSQTFTEIPGQEFTITAKYPKIVAHIRSSIGYYPGELDGGPEIDLSTLDSDVIITASSGYSTVNPNRQIVDMTDWYSNNNSCISNGYFTESTKDFFKSTKPSSFKKAFEYMNGDTIYDYTPLNLLDMSNCTSLNTGIEFNCVNTSILNLSSWDTSNVTDFYGAISIFAGWSGKIASDIVTIDINGWDFSKATNIEFMINYAVVNNINAISEIFIDGIIDFINNPSYRNMLGTSPAYVCNKIKSPIKLKNVPSDFNYQTAGFTSEDQFQILSYR